MHGPQHTAKAAAAVLLLGLLAGCGGKPMPFPAPESELGPRPGLFTGETGTWDTPIVRDRTVVPAQPTSSGGPK